MHQRADRNLQGVLNLTESRNGSFFSPGRPTSCMERTGGETAAAVDTPPIQVFSGRNLGMRPTRFLSRSVTGFSMIPATDSVLICRWGCMGRARLGWSFIPWMEPPSPGGIRLSC